MKRRLSLPTRTWGTRLAVLGVAASLVAAIFKSNSWPLLLLEPGAVFGDWQLWRPFTYLFLDTQPMSVLFGALILWGVGSALEQSWGARRFLWLAVGMPVLAGFLTGLLAPLLPTLPLGYGGLSVMASTLWVAYGLAYGRRLTNFWGLSVSGYAFAALGVLLLALNAAMTHWALVVPEALSVGAAALYVRFGGAASWWTRFRGWQLQRRLHSRAKHLTVVGGDKPASRGSDRYLH